MEQNGSATPQRGPPITADEVALYDRQIRLWGLKAQEKIRNADILLLSMTSLAAEIAKNLVLAGIHSITIMDHTSVTAQDLGANFFLSEQDVGANRAVASAVNIRKLNPRVTVVADQTDLSQILTAPLVEKFDLIIATGQMTNTLNLINTAARLQKKPFYAASVYGMYGFIFSDLIEHEFVVQRNKNTPTEIGAESRTRSVLKVTEKMEEGKPIELVKKLEKYSTWFLSSDVALLPEEYTKSRRRMKNVTPVLSCLRGLWDFQALNGYSPASMDDLRTFTALVDQKHKALGLPGDSLNSGVIGRFFQNIHSEITPVSAILGGQLAQDVINVLGGQQQPIQNFVVFDGDTMEAPVFALHPPGNLGADLLPETAEAVERMIEPQPQALPVSQQTVPSNTLPPTQPGS